MRLILAALMLCVIAVTAADARPRHKKKDRSESLSALLHRVMVQNERLAQELADIKKWLQPDAVTKVEPVEEPVQLGFRNPVLEAAIPIGKTIAGYADHIAKSAKLTDLTPGLASKVREILGTCPGSKVISSYRRGARVKGSNRPSLHSLYPSQAADMAGNPSCMYSILRRGWVGGYSTDYRAVNHIHLSLSSSGRERGARFVHYRGARYAKHHSRKSYRYAMRREHYQPEPYQKHAVAQ